MGVRIRCIELLAMTASGAFGVQIPISDGLTVISAPNTSGKSTCVMAIIYGLGLEGMLGPSHVPPFPAAMMDKLFHNGIQYEVISSQVRLEIENDKGEVVTVQRKVLASPLDRQLVRVEFGRSITSPAEYPRSDFFVRTSGSATSDLGFQAFLANFAGYEIPFVNGADGSHIPLYLECIFPYFFVDQISGWRDVKARMPTYLRIPEMAKRAFEFTLRLDVLIREVLHQSLLQTEVKLNHLWRNELTEAKREIQGTGLMIDGIPDEPDSIWPPSSPARLIATDGEKWYSYREYFDSLSSSLNRIRTETLPSTERASEEILNSLQNAEDALGRAEEIFATLNGEFRAEHSQVLAIDERLSALREDLRKYQNAKRLKVRGGISELKIAEGLCPTCHQPIKDALLPQDRAANPMSLEDNIVFIKGQIDIFQEMREESRASLTAREEQLNESRERVARASTLVHDFRRQLRSDAQAPSTAAIREEIQLESRLALVARKQSAFDSKLERFADLSKEWTKVQSQLKELKASGLSARDNAKLQSLNVLYADQLRRYGFSSYRVDEVQISNETYRPSIGNFDLGLTSASDAIRSVWSYLLGLLELARDFPDTNHIGFVVFDEPKQQSTADFSFAVLLQRAAASITSSQQVIFATSEHRDRLDSMLEGLQCNYVKFDDKMLRPFAPST